MLLEYPALSRLWSWPTSRHKSLKVLCTVRPESHWPSFLGCWMMLQPKCPKSLPFKKAIFLSLTPLYDEVGHYCKCRKYMKHIRRHERFLNNSEEVWITFVVNNFPCFSIFFSLRLLPTSALHNVSHSTVKRHNVYLVQDLCYSLWGIYTLINDLIGYPSCSSAGLGSVVRVAWRHFF